MSFLTNIFDIFSYLNSDPSWIFKYCTDFSSLVPFYKKLCDTEAENNQAIQPSENDDIPLSQGQLIPIMDDQHELSEFNLSPAGAFLSKKTFRGLEPHFGETPLLAAVEGRSGLAKSYVNEPHESQSHSIEPVEKNSNAL